VTFGLRGIEIATLEKIAKNWLFCSAKYLRKSWANLHQVFKFDRPMGADDQSGIRSAVLQGSLLW